jgi:hypothetical protein
VKNTRLYWLMGLWGIGLASQLLLPFPTSIIHITFIVLLLITMMFFKTGINFLLFLASMLIYGFGLTVYAFANELFDEGQYPLICYHLMLTGSMLLTWLTVHDIKSFVQTNLEMQTRIRELEKFDPGTNALSLQEFRERGVLIETGMRRRGEIGQLLYFKIKKDIPLPVRRSLRQEFIKCCLDSVRAEYDLVTSPTEAEVLILLQSTDVAGREVVLNRINGRTKKTLNFVQMPYEIQLFELENLEQKLDELFKRKGA